MRCNKELLTYLQHFAEGFNLGVHCYADDGQLYFYDRVQALPSVISKVVSNLLFFELVTFISVLAVEWIAPHKHTRGGAMTQR